MVCACVCVCACVASSWSYVRTVNKDQWRAFMSRLCRPCPRETHGRRQRGAKAPAKDSAQLIFGYWCEHCGAQDGIDVIGQCLWLFLIFFVGHSMLFKVIVHKLGGGE